MMLWAIVGIPLAWGVWKTLVSAIKIFGSGYCRGDPCGRPAMHATSANRATPTSPGFKNGRHARAPRTFPAAGRIAMPALLRAYRPYRPREFHGAHFADRRDATSRAWRDERPHQGGPSRRAAQRLQAPAAPPRA